jgi:SAM-dependent methyltransferase
MPSEEDVYELNKSFWEYQPNTESSRRFYYTQALHRVEYLKNHLNDFESMEILEIGSGHAYIYNVLKYEIGQINYSVVEADQNMREELSRKGIKNIYENWNSIRDIKFDLIILSHILEHFPKPRAYSREIKDLLKKDGYIFIEVPNQDDLYKENLGAHLIVFNEKSFYEFFEELNMNIVNIVTIGENIAHLMKAKNKLKIIRKKVKKYCPQLVVLKRNLLGKKAKGKTAIDSIDYKFNNYNDNGRWIRVLVKKNNI